MLGNTLTKRVLHVLFDEYWPQGTEDRTDEVSIELLLLLVLLIWNIEHHFLVHLTLLHELGEGELFECWDFKVKKLFCS